MKRYRSLCALIICICSFLVLKSSDDIYARITLAPLSLAPGDSVTYHLNCRYARVLEFPLAHRCENLRIGIANTDNPGWISVSFTNTSQAPQPRATQSEALPPPVAPVPALVCPDNQVKTPRPRSIYCARLLYCGKRYTAE